MELVWEIRTVLTIARFHPLPLNSGKAPGADTQRADFNNELFIDGWLVQLRGSNMQLLRDPSRHADLLVLRLRKSRPHGAQC